MKSTFLLSKMTFLCLILLMYSCKKDTTFNQINNIPKEQQSEEEIRNFIYLSNQYAAGKILKNGEKLPIQEALDYISNTLNYAYCYPLSNVREVKSNNFQIKIPIIEVEEKTYLVDALSAYNEAVLKVKSYYKEFNDLSKKLICVYAKPDTMTNDTLYVRIFFNIGFGRPRTTSYPYDNLEQFWYTENGGNCSQVLPPPSGDGSPAVFMNDIKDAFSFVPAPGVHIYYSYEQPIDYLNPEDFTNNASWNIQNDNFCDYKFYFAKHVDNEPELPIKTFCLGIDEDHPDIHEMNYYYDAMISQFCLDIPSGREFVDINIQSMNTFEDGIMKYYHVVHLVHGIRNATYSMDYPKNIDE